MKISNSYLLQHIFVYSGVFTRDDFERSREIEVFAYPVSWCKAPPTLRTKTKENCLKRRLFRILVRCLRRGTFLSPNKKVPKEVGLGGGVESLLPQSKPPSP